MDHWSQMFTNPNFIPHGHCYLWQPDILWTHVISDFVVGISYYAIPVVLAIFLLKRKNFIIYPEIFTLFVVFIFLCGTTHFVSIYVTWYPAYEVQGWLKAATALVSVTTACVLVPKLPLLVALPGIQDAYERNLHALENIRVEKAEMQIVHDLAMNRESRIAALKEEVNALLLAQDQSPKYSIIESAD